MHERTCATADLKNRSGIPRVRGLRTLFLKRVRLKSIISF